uniref:Uncharacterized protein n=1 Tax=Streptomyces sp. 44030 TaxID=364102 RepID=Q2LEV4_9ACTN|nr:hypothetical protein [Streptomyces sp. 44030]ABC67331.1 hypothetical protein pRL1.2 [Streptomyces sp. 44030]ABC67361.1 hypothetical protein pRL1.32c [Streptomyces sp. 44030]
MQSRATQRTCGEEIAVPSTEEAVHKAVVETGIPEIVRYLQEVLGQKLTAFIAGTTDPKNVARWSRGDHSPRPDTERKLRAAFQVFQLLQQYDSEGVVRAWFIGMNPHLDDESPAEVLRDGRLREVLSAARLFTQS